MGSVENHISLSRIKFPGVFNADRIRRVLEDLSMLQWTLTFLFLGPAGTSVFLVLLFSAFAPLAILYFIWFWFFDYRTPERGGRRSHWVRSWKVWEYCCNYLPLRLRKTVDLDPTKNYIFLYHPHGIMALGAFLGFSTAAGRFEETFPGLRATLLSLKYQFVTPFNRDYVMALGVCSCSRVSIDWLLKGNGPGNAVVLVVGGASEALEARPGSYTLTLANRKGFAKIALQSGTELVPVFAFGENDLYKQLPNPPGSLLRRLQDISKKILTFSFPVCHGRGLFNSSIGLLPFRTPINIVVGSPLSVPLIEEPTNEQIDDIHRRYLNHLSELFESNKSKYGVGENAHLNYI